MKWIFPTVLALALAGAALASPQSFEGVISDSMCGKKHMVPGKTDAECTSVCVKANSQYALVVGDKVYTLSGAQGELQKLAGRKVRIVGDADGKTIAVSSVAEIASH